MIDFVAVFYLQIFTNSVGFQTMVVRMRANRSHRDNCRAHFALKSPRFSVCKDCGASTLRHRVCITCGKYKGVQVLDVHAKIEKKAKKHKEKAKDGAK